MAVKIRPYWARFFGVVCLLSIGTGATFLSIMSLVGGADSAYQATSVSTSPGPSPVFSPGPATAPSIEVSPGVAPSLTPDPPVPEPTVTPPSSPPLNLAIPKLIIPVSGIRIDQLRDTFSDARSQLRVHNAIDIMAPQGATVVAAVDGKIVKLHFSDKGGITIYQTSVEETLVFYYAHLDRYAEGLREGQRVQQGETIGYVGDTGNASTGSYHLHFAIWTITDSKRYWDGIPINPYPLLSNPY